MSFRSYSRLRLDAREGVSAFLIVLVLGCFASGSVLISWPVVEALLARRWTPISCMITRSRIRDLGEDSDGEPRYEFDLHYRFRLADSEIYSGDRYSFDPRSPTHPELVRLVSTAEVSAVALSTSEAPEELASVPIGADVFMTARRLVGGTIVAFMIATTVAIFSDRLRDFAWIPLVPVAIGFVVHFSFILKYSSRPQVKLFVPEGGRPTVGRQCILRWRFEGTLHHANFEMEPWPSASTNRILPTRRGRCADKPPGR
ncbi:MAG: hypothetical protein H6729_05435 [Deltaproteobacteria bacterium]|nr:hypothetical protein [Deltaproteobacteria bacterium]